MTARVKGRSGTGRALTGNDDGDVIGAGDRFRIDRPCRSCREKATVHDSHVVRLIEKIPGRRGWAALCVECGKWCRVQRREFAARVLP